MEKEINLNNEFAALLEGHGINIIQKDEFLETDLPHKIKFKARSTYTEVGNNINSRMDVMAVSDQGEQIIESCGDIGETLEEAIRNNFQSFSIGSLHPLLAALDCLDPHTYEQITLEEWEINGKLWKVYIGNITRKLSSEQQNRVYVPSEFFDAVERSIKSQKLANRLHWFRAYYCQVKDQIPIKEFLMDNVLLGDTGKIFQNLPIIPAINYFSCRIFISLRDSSKL